MMRHLNDDELLKQLYGLGDGGHLDECPECAGRLAAMELRRADSAAEGVRVSSGLLGRQRRAIYARLEQPVPARVRWAPALAAATLLAVGVFIYHPMRAVPQRGPAPAARPEMSEEQLFSDVFSMEQAAEPRAAAPIRALFEEHLFEEHQGPEE
jgi:hypothetical protein